jgi:hypothetical protein
MNLRTINRVIDKLELHKIAAECAGKSTELLDDCITVAKYAKGQFKLDKQRKKSKLGVNDSSLKEKEKKI